MECSAGQLVRSRLLKPLLLGSCLFSPSLLLAQDLTVIGGTSVQRRLTACIEHISTEDLGRLPGSDHSITVVILERERFLQAKNSFGAQRTKLAFSNLAIRRVYLSSDVFRDIDTTLWCLPHELGHFVTRSIYENPAEIAAERIRKRAQEICIVPTAPAPRGVLSSRSKNPAGPD